MKFLVWFIALLIPAIIVNIARLSGILLGALPTFIIWGIAIFLARYICKSIDEKREEEATKALVEQNRQESAALRLAAQDPHSHASSTPEEAILLPVEPLPAQEPAKKKTLGFCRACGQPIDGETGRCAGCGKQYRKIKFFLLRIKGKVIPYILFPLSLAVAITFGALYFSSISPISPSAKNLSRTVYASSAYYHSTPNCSTSSTVEMTKQEALESSRIPCAKCYQSDRKIYDEYKQNHKDGIAALLQTGNTDANTNSLGGVAGLRELLKDNPSKTQRQYEPTVGYSPTVYITASGSKYHSSSTCSNMKNPISTITEVAEEDGYTPCSKCWWPSPLDI